MKGTVQAISAKEFNGTLLFSAKVGENWIGFGADKPPFNKGDVIELEVTTNNRGRLVAVKDTIKAATASVVEGKAPVAWAKSGKDDYWVRREERDIHTQEVIQLQASRNSAIALASAMLQAGAVPGFEKAADKKKYDIVLALVEELTDHFEQQSTSKRAGDFAKAEAEPDKSVEDKTDEDGIWGD